VQEFFSNILVFMQKSNCLNCNSAIYPQQKFCRHCGQRTDIRRLTFGQLLIDFFRGVFSLEKAMFRLAKGLLTTPGRTATAMVEGKRKYYLNPFTFVAICITFVLLLQTWFGLTVDPTTYDPKFVASQPLYVQASYVIDAINNKMMDLSTLLMSPWFACCLWIFFRRRNRNVAEMTVATMLFIAFATLLTRIFVAPMLASTTDINIFNWIQGIELLLQTIYISWGLSLFLNYKNFGGFLKVLGVVCLAGIVGMALEFGIIMLLIVNGII